MARCTRLWAGRTDLPKYNECIATNYETAAPISNLALRVHSQLIENRRAWQDVSCLQQIERPSLYHSLEGSYTRGICYVAGSLRVL